MHVPAVSFYQMVNFEGFCCLCIGWGSIVKIIGLCRLLSRVINIAAIVIVVVDISSSIVIATLKVTSVIVILVSDIETAVSIS